MLKRWVCRMMKTMRRWKMNEVPKVVKMIFYLPSQS